MQTLPADVAWLRLGDAVERSVTNRSGMIDVCGRPVRRAGFVLSKGFPAICGRLFYRLFNHFDATETERYFIAEAGVVKQFVENGVRCEPKFVHEPDYFGFVGREAFYKDSFPFGIVQQFEIVVERKGKFFAVKIAVLVEQPVEQYLVIGFVQKVEVFDALVGALQ